jgi:hypothetical protein
MISTVFAQLPDFDALEGAFEDGGGTYRFSGVSLADFFNLGLTNIIFFFAAAGFVFYLITGGIAMMTSRGDPKALEGAKARVTSGLIGFFIVFSAYWIVQIVGILLGLDGFGGVFGG